MLMDVASSQSQKKIRYAQHWHVAWLWRQFHTAYQPLQTWIHSALWIQVWEVEQPIHICQPAKDKREDTMVRVHRDTLTPYLVKY